MTARPHAATPYEVTTNSAGDRVVVVAPYDTGRVCVCDAASGPLDLREANAAFIARACSAHGALVGTLRRLLDAIDRMPANPCDGLADEARALLKTLE